MATTLQEIQDEWDVWMEPTYINKQGQTKKTVAQTWRDQNPGEFSQLLAYREGGQKPMLATSMGRQMVEHVEAWLTEKGEVIEPPPPPPPPSSNFGSRLFEGLEWAQAESSGPVVSVSTLSELTSTISRSGAIIDCGGRSINLGGQLSLPNVSQLTTLQNGIFTGGRVDKSNSSKWRLRNLDVSLGSPEDNVKGSSGAFLHIDKCRIHHAPRQGVLLYPHSDFVMSNCRVYENGSITNQDHGIYAGEGSRLLIYNSVFYNNQAYQGQFYPHYHGGLVVCCTFYGGRTRGGVVIGSEGSDPVSDLRFIGVISSNNSHGWGFDSYGTLGSGISLEDCLGWANASGDFDSGSWTVIRPKHGDPKFVNPTNGDFSLGVGSAAKGIIDQSLWAFVPATDINGKARITGDAGAYAA